MCDLYFTKDFKYEILRATSKKWRLHAVFVWSAIYE